MTSETARPTHCMFSPGSARIPTSNSLLSLPKSRPHGIRGVQSYSLRYPGLYPGPSVHPPCSPHATVSPLDQIIPTRYPWSPIVLSRRPSLLVPRTQVRAGLEYALLGTSTRTSVTHSQPIICIPSSSFRPLRMKAKTRILCPVVILPTSSIPSKRLSVKSRSTLKYAQPLVKSSCQAKPAMRTPALVAMGAKSTLLLTLMSPPVTIRKGCIRGVKKFGK